ncbi:hypothetical protein PsorP6_008714 [Peronosclerospora sorghi]|uniref:Uncharacterized protein n=1 Tax=Peronosclerospora sorghi TaxID=230839 RepID=A0ACC0VYH1_9STRA|nr:hypothetical protein PsorP6_008714 [Peronosclerospora sorghi]
MTYKAIEKRWKHASCEAFSQNAALVDPQNLSDEHKANVQRIGYWKWGPDNENRPVLAFDGFGTSHRGFYVIPKALDAKTQLQFAFLCLTEFSEEPHLTNMHLQNQQESNIWLKSRESDSRDPKKSPVLSKLCWSTLGYHYDWTARKYDKDKFSVVPTLLQKLGASCAIACGTTLSPEAVIINYYKSKSSMGGHLDDVEYTMDHPVVSVSLGSQCVFLKGGHTRNESPMEVLLRSGDITIMGGASRLCYHGVARVLPTSFNIKSEDFDMLPREKWEDFEAVRTYLSSHRININLRQVYPTDPPKSEEKIDG